MRSFKLWLATAVLLILTVPEAVGQLPRVIWPRENVACINGTCFADAFPGSTVTEQIANCLADAAPLNGSCIVPAKMGAGDIPAVPAGSTLIDLRTGAVRLGNTNRLQLGPQVDFRDPSIARIYVGKNDNTFDPVELNSIGLLVEEFSVHNRSRAAIEGATAWPAGVAPVDNLQSLVGVSAAARNDGSVTTPVNEQFGVAASTANFAGTTTTAAAYWALCNSVGAGTSITTCSGLDVDRVNTTGGGTITNAYGVRIRGIGTTGVTNRYVFYAGGPDAAGAPVRIPDVTFENLPTGTAAENGSMLYCTNCTRTDPCASGGTGAFAFRINGTWVCSL